MDYQYVEIPSFIKQYLEENNLTIADLIVSKAKPKKIHNHNKKRKKKR